MKFIFFLLLFALVWYGFKAFTRQASYRLRRQQWEEEIAELLARVAATARSSTQAQPQAQNRPGEPSPAPVEDLQPCKICGTYFAPRQARRCDRADCPF